MTFVKKYLGLVVGGSVALVLALIALVLLFQFSGAYRQVQDDLQVTTMNLQQLRARKPFPSNENVERVSAREQELNTYLSELLTQLSEAQRPVPAMERAAFPAALDRTAQRLRAVAAETSSRISPELAFGFDRYVAGSLPTEEQVPRLVRQLRTVALLCTSLFRGGIAELTEVQREVFETRVAVVPQVSERDRRRSREPVPEPADPATLLAPDGVPGLYTKERYTLAFAANDEAVRAVLNNLVLSPVMIVVRQVELTNGMAAGSSSAADMLAARLRALSPTERGGAASTGRSAGGTGALTQQEDRVVAGRERVQVRLTLDVYHFEGPMAEEEPS